MIDWTPGERIISTSTPVATGIPETDEWEVVAKGRIKVIQATTQFESYLNIGEEYDLIPHKPEDYSQLWEIDVAHTKRPESSSQILLYDWNDEDGAKPSMEIDS